MRALDPNSEQTRFFLPRNLSRNGTYQEPAEEKTKGTGVRHQVAGKME